MNMKKYHQIYYLKISSNLLFENIIKFVFFAILVAFICELVNIYEYEKISSNLKKYS